MSYTAPDLADGVENLLRERGYEFIDGNANAFQMPGAHEHGWYWQHVASGQKGETLDSAHGAVMDALEHMVTTREENLAQAATTAALAEHEETERQRLEREFQEAIAKWHAREGGMVELCAAIVAGYEAEHGGLDDDMVPLLIDLGDRAADIRAVYGAARAVVSTWKDGDGEVATFKAALKALDDSL